MEAGYLSETKLTSTTLATVAAAGKPAVFRPPIGSGVAT